MRAVIQRVSRAAVRVDGGVAGEIGAGLLVLLGVASGDGETEAERLAGNVARLRIFPDDEGRFDRCVLDTGGAVLVVSQFTLIADTAKGNRPSFTGAAPPGGGGAVATSGSARRCVRWSSRGNGSASGPE